jgi:hypothetical protein
VAVVLAAVTGALVNELHGGWAWWLACTVVVAASATLAMWLASHSSSDPRVHAGPGAVIAGRDIQGGVHTRVWGRAVMPAPEHEDACVSADGGGVVAGRDITGGVTTVTDETTGPSVPNPAP